MKKSALVFAAMCMALVCGCGYLTNSTFFEGEGRVKGRVTVEGAPREGVMVFVLGEFDPENMVISEPDGTFELIARAGEEKFMIATWGGGLGLRHRFDLAGDADRQLGDLQLGGMGVINGKVGIDDPSQAEVEVSGTPFVERPDADGAYRLVLPEGRWDLTIRAPGYEAETLEGVNADPGQTQTTQTTSLPLDPNYTCEGTEARTDRFSQGGEGEVDILFVMDNSGSMVGEQLALATSFGNFTAALEDASVDYRIAVVTPGMESPGCPHCDSMITASCMNETGENGRFQDRLGHNQGSEDFPDYVFTSDSSCRVVTQNNLDCLYDPELERGTVLVGINGCGYERGLAGMRIALDDLANTYNQDFLRPWARLAVIVVSDEDDCGEVGDVTESLQGIGGDVCYYAAKGVDPEGNTGDPEGKPYRLTPVSEYADFLKSLKISPALVSFSAIVGVTDPENPASTSIEYELNGSRWEITDACTTPGCTGEWCYAEPGTRYIELARQLNGTVETICQEDFSTPMLNVVGASTGYTRIFKLSKTPVSPDSIRVLVNNQETITGYRYEADIRTIVFEQDHTPPPYSLVKVSYDVACD